MPTLISYPVRHVRSESYSPPMSVGFSKVNNLLAETVSRYLIVPCSLRKRESARQGRSPKKKNWVPISRVFWCGHLSRTRAEVLPAPTRRLEDEQPTCCLVLLLTRFACRSCCQEAVGSLPQPFHPYPLGGIFLRHSL